MINLLIPLRAWQFLEILINESIVQGYEGIMIKDPESFYECKRSTTWLKSLKPVIEISLEVKDFRRRNWKKC